MRGLPLLLCPLMLVAAQAVYAKGPRTCENLFKASQATPHPLSIHQHMGKAKSLLKPLPQGADVGYHKQVLVKPLASESTTPEEAWRQMATMIVAWVKSQRDMSFAGVEDAKVLFEGGEYRETPGSKLSWNITTRVIVGNGSPERPQHWVLEFSHTDRQNQNERWLTRVVISTEPNSDHLHLFADNSHYDVEASSARRVTHVKTFLKFFSKVETRFEVVTGASDRRSSHGRVERPAEMRSEEKAAKASTNGQSQSRNQPQANSQASESIKPKQASSAAPAKGRSSVSLINQLRVSFDQVLTAQGNDPVSDEGDQPVLQKLKEIGEALKAGGLDVKELQINKSQKAKLVEINDSLVNTSSLIKILEVYRSLEQIGFEIPETWKTTLAAKLRKEPVETIESLTLQEIDQIAVLFKPIRLEGDSYQRLLNRSVLIHLETQLFRKLEVRSRGPNSVDLPLLFHALALVSFNISDVLLTPGRSTLISSAASDLVGQLEIKHFNNLIKVLTNYRTSLSSDGEAALVQHVSDWLKSPQIGRRIDLTNFANFAALLGRPSPEFVTQVSTYFSNLLNQKAVTPFWTGRLLYTIWLLDPKQALEFARGLDATVTVDIHSDPDDVKRFKKIAQYFEVMFGERFDWINAYITKYSRDPENAQAGSEHATQVMDLLKRIVPERTLQKSHVLRGTHIEIDVMVPSERLAIQYERPFDYLTDRTGHRRVLPDLLREDEILKKLGLFVFRLRHTEVKVLSRLPDERFQRVATAGKPVKRILLDLLKR